MSLIYKIRQTESIESRLDLLQAVVNNLAVYFNNLPPKFEYSLRIASSVTLADGTKQMATTQRVLIGTYPSGGPKYKTVVSKFILMTLFQKTEGGIRKKIEEILIGYADILSYNPSYDEVQKFSAELPQLLKAYLTPVGDDFLETPITNEPKPEVKPEAGEVLFPFVTKTGDHVFRNYKETGRTPDRLLKIDNGAGAPLILKDEETMILQNVTRAPTPASAPVVSDALNAGYTSAGFLFPGASATTLKEWWQGYKRVVPLIPERALLYEAFGLGPRGIYIASAEQNIALLKKLQGK